MKKSKQIETVAWARYEVIYPHVRDIDGQTVMLEPMFSGIVTLPDDEDTRKCVERGWLKEVFPFQIEVRPLLVCAMLCTGPKGITVLMADNLTRTEAAHTVWHEMVHLLLRAGGGKTQHDEEHVEAIAERLAAACPEVLELCGIENKFPR